VARADPDVVRRAGGSRGALAEVVLQRRERVAVALDHFADLGRQGVLEDREEAW